MAVGDLVDLDENGEQTPSLIVVSPVAERVAPSAGAWMVAECPLQSLWQFVVAYQVPAGKTTSPQSDGWNGAPVDDVFGASDGRSP